MTDHRQHLTTEDFAERTPADRDTADRHTADRDALGHTTFDRTPPDHTSTGHTSADHTSADHTSTGHTSTGYDTADDRSGDRTPDTRFDEREPVEQTPADHDVAEPDLTDQERSDREAVPQQEQPQHSQPTELSEVSTTAGDAPLFTGDDAADYQAEWRALQADFVDDPREAVQRADELVAQVMQSLATTFNQHKHALEEQWQRGDEVQTEELRQALKRYRSFFDRLLSV
ncbi:hypothetical protein [Saccharothrix sp. HUAS TT1]|uniref:hypothetical protein n=1 Tax=unclassified Saccharothrix TaxID=2593673 RepID=UPI00345C236F